MSATDHRVATVRNDLVYEVAGTAVILPNGKAYYSKAQAVLEPEAL
jgi:hypothetical protein